MAELDPLTNLPKKEDIPANFNPLKGYSQSPGAKGLPKGTGINIDSPYEFGDFEFDLKRDQYLQKGMNQEAHRARQQTIGGQLFNGIIGGVVSAAGTAIEDIGYMIQFRNNIGTMLGIEEAHDIAISRWGKQLKEWTNESMPIYRKDPTQFFDLNDFGSYMTATKSLIDNAIGFAIPSGAAFKVITKAQRLLGLARITRMSKPLTQMAATVGAGYWANVGESKMMALETFENTKRDLMENHGLSEEDATKYAGEAARDMYVWNKVFMLGDMFAVAGLNRAKGLTRNMIQADDISRFGRYKKAFGTFSSDDLLAQGLTEYAEEIGQSIISKESQFQATRRNVPIEQPNNDMFLRAVDNFMKGETQYEGILGFLGGAGQRVITAAIAGDRSDALLKMQKEQQELIDSTKDFIVNELNSQQELTNIIRDARLQNDDHMVSLARRANLTKAAVRNFQRGTTESLLNLLQDRVDANEENAAEDLEFVKKLERQWISDTRFVDEMQQAKVFHARESVKMAQDRLGYYQTQLAEAEAQLEATPADGVAAAKVDQIKKDIQEMETVLQELNKGLKKVSTVQFGRKLKKLRETAQKEFEKKRREAAAQRKQKEKKTSALAKAKKWGQEKRASLKELYEKTKEWFETEPETKFGEDGTRQETQREEPSQTVQETETTRPESVEEVEERDTTEPTRRDQEQPAIEKQLQETEKKVEKLTRTEEFAESQETPSEAPPAKTRSMDLDGMIQQESTQEQTVAQEESSHFVHIAPNGEIQVQDGIPGSEMPFTGSKVGSAMVVSPAENKVALDNEAGLKQAFEGTETLKNGDKFVVDTPADYVRTEDGWQLRNKGKVTKVDDGAQLSDKQQVIGQLADEIRALVEDDAEADLMPASMSNEKRLKLMNLSTQMFTRAAELILEEDPNYNFNSIEGFLRTMREVNATVTTETMKIIYPYIKGFYGPTFQIDPNLNDVVNRLTYEEIFLTDEELEQLFDSTTDLVDSAIPEEMLTEEKLLGIREQGERLQTKDIHLTEHDELDAPYNKVFKASNKLAFLHRVYEQTSDGKTVMRFDTDEFIDDYGAVLDPDVMFPGATFEVEVVDDDSMPMYLPGGAENEMTTWGEIKDNAEEYMKYYNLKSVDELKTALMPIAVKKDGKVIAYIHNVEFINPLRVAADEAERFNDAQELMRMRRQIIGGVVESITIEEVSGGHIFFPSDGKKMAMSEAIKEEHNDEIIVGIMRDGQVVGHNTDRITHIVNEEDIFPGMTYIYIPVHGGYFAAGVENGRLDEKTVDGLVHAIMIAMHKGPVDEKIQSRVDAIKKAMGIDITAEGGLQEYLSYFLYNFQPNKSYDNFKERGYRSALDAFIQEGSGIISSDHRFINFSGNSVDFGIGNASQTYSLSKESDAATKAMLKDKLKAHLMGARLQVSIDRLVKNPKTSVVVITRDGVETVPGNTYLDFIKQGLLMSFRPIMTAEGKMSLTYQPTISFKPNLNQAETRTMQVQTPTAEPGEEYTPLQYVKDVPSNRTKVIKKMGEFMEMSDQELTDIFNTDKGIKKEAARLVLWNRGIEDIQAAAEERDEYAGMSPEDIANLKAAKAQWAAEADKESVYLQSQEDGGQAPDPTIPQWVDEGFESEEAWEKAQKAKETSEDLANQLGIGKPKKRTIDPVSDDMIAPRKEDLDVDNKCKI